MAIGRETLANVSGLTKYTDLVSNATSEDNITGGAPVLYHGRFDNQLNSAASFVKICDAASATPGTTAPNYVFKVAGLARMTFSIVRLDAAGGATFQTGLSVFTTTAGGTAGTGAPTNAVTVELVAA